VLYSYVVGGRSVCLPIFIASLFQCGSVLACECDPLRPYVVTSPVDGEDGVPLDAAVFVRWDGLGSFNGIQNPELLSEDGRAVQLTRHVVDNPARHTLVMFKPTDELAPETSYTMLDPLPEFTFRTAPSIEESAPPIPPILRRASVSGDVGGGCTKSAFIAVESEMPAHLLMFDVNGRAHVEVEDGEDAVRRLAPGGRSEVVQHQLGGTPGPVLIGFPPCEYANLPDAQNDELLAIRAAAVDRQGRVSGWSEPLRGRLPSRDTCGCRTSGSPGLLPLPSPAWLTLAVAVLLARWRRVPVHPGSPCRGDDHRVNPVL
jgi:MYXO-CTERM domain-containing protein